MEKTQTLKKGYLFENLTEKEFQMISEIAKSKDVIAGDYVFDEGSDAKSMFIVQFGTVEILKKSGDGSNDQSVVQFSPGSLFGEMAFFERAKRAASAMAKENVKLVEIAYDDLERLVASNPTFGLKIYKTIASVLCRRIRQTTSNLSELKELKLKHL